MSRRSLNAFAVMLAITLLLPLAAAAQSASGGGIAGEVKDATGAILPGVTVEAASPALIEKVRSAVTDGRGQFNIVDLRPGTYTVTFTLPAFTTVRREGVELTAGFTAVINATLRVGGVEETVTVSGASPIVDTVNVRTQNVLSHEVLEALPTAKGVPGLSALTLGTVGAIQDVGGNRAESPASFSFHGSRNTDQRIKYDGMSMNSFHTTGGGPNRLMLLNQVAIQEMVLETSGISAESETGGVQMNAVPREGGNRFRVSVLANYANDALQSTNVTSELTALGLTTPPSVKKIYDLGLGVGGPIRRDKLWFYSANRRWGAEESLANVYWNATPATPFYVPDLSRPVFAANNLEDYGVRFTWQAAAKHKLSFSENAQRSCVCPSAPAANRTPDASDDFRYGGSDGTNNGFHHLVQTSWSYPATNRLLFDAGASFGYFLQSNVPVDGAYDRIGITDSAQNISYSSLNGSLFGASYSILSNGEQVSNASHNLNQRVSVSYVTGSHAFKTGAVTTFGIHDVYRSLNRYAIQYTFQNRVPNSLTEWTSPTVLRSRVFGAGLFAQDQWKAVQKLTVNLGVRFDTFNARTLEEHLPAARFVGARDYPAVENVPNWRDITPRVGVAYDLFGDGRTAVKGSLGRYVIGLGIAISEANHPAQQEVSSTSRTWNDSFFPVGDPRRGNYVPDCDLLSPSLNDECGAMSATTFGTKVVTNRWDPEVLNGFGQRDYNWQGAVSLQHELRNGIGLNASYFYRTFGNFRVTDNLAVTPQDFSPYCITVPNDPRLPGAGQPLCGLYDINPSVFGLQNNLVTSVKPYGKQTEVYNGVEFSINARFGRGGRLAGGVSTGRTNFDQCQVVDSPQQNLFCNYQLPWQGQTQVKLNGSYPLPWQIQLSAVLQNLAGIPVTASYSATNAEIAPTLNRNLGQCRASATCAGTVVINNLYEPNTEFADRLTQVDVRATKIFAMRNAHVQAMFDVYNLFNANTVLALNNRYSSTGVNLWQQPTSILAGRLFKFGVQFDY